MQRSAAEPAEVVVKSVHHVAGALITKDRVARCGVAGAPVERDQQGLLYLTKRKLDLRHRWNLVCHRGPNSAWA